MENSVVEKDYHEEEYFGNVRLDGSAVLQTGEDVVVSMKNIHKTYLLGVEGVPALRGVSLTIKKGEHVCIFGTSGGGKTTMLNIIGTIDKPTKGEMILCGHMINHKTDDLTLAMLRLKKIGFVFQTFNLLSSLTALENVEMPMILAGDLTANERRTRAVSLLTKVGMGSRLDHVPAQLSGGEQQRVTIARAMANKPEILLLDEPTGDLDTANTAIVMKLLKELNKDEGITLIMVTHDVGLKMFSDRVVWMRDGKIQRIEAITPSAREECHRKLDEEIELIEKKKAGLVPRAAVNTITRDPSDYKPLNWRKTQQPHQQQQQRFSLSSSNGASSSSSSFPSSSTFPSSSQHPSSNGFAHPSSSPPLIVNGNGRRKEEGEEGRMGAIIGGLAKGIKGLAIDERKEPATSTPLLIEEEL